MDNNLINNAEMVAKFEAVRDEPWRPVMTDPCTGDWTQQWFLDGFRGWVRNTPEGMVYSAGPVDKDSGSHAVLWTRESFEGDIRIEFDFERLDTVQSRVNILYFHATGKGQGPYSEDITEWSHLRHVPAMSTYYNNLNALHISYAAFPNRDDQTEDYIRMRRYPVTPERSFKDLPVMPEYNNTGFFAPGVPHHFVVIKKGHDIYFHLTAEPADGQKKQALMHWNTSALPDLTHGRIGLRHMATRCSLYRDFKVFGPAE